LTDGDWDNESIESIVIKSRAEEVGYARQNNLISGVWIDIHFSGDLPLTLTGKITNLIEDKIEVTTFPNDDVIFIDFKYQGLPEDLIKYIKIRKAPEASVRKERQSVEEQEEQAQGEGEQVPPRKAPWVPQRRGPGCLLHKDPARGGSQWGLLQAPAAGVRHPAQPHPHGVHLF
jgi:hypothetical protein